MDIIKEINPETLRSWLDSDKPVTVVDIRPTHEREEWQIPGSVHVNVYDQLKAKESDAMDHVAFDKSAPVVTVCAGGNTSRVAAELLQSKGYDVYSLKGGMKGWSMSWNIARQSYSGFDIIQFRRTGKGCLSYMIISDGEAMAVDASLQPDVYQDIIKKENLILKFAVDTHIHADHLTRSIQLAELNQIHPHLPFNDKVTYHFHPIENNALFEVGNIKIKPIHTPGHTYESMSYLIDDKVLLTGDTLFTDGIGRPDLKTENDEAVKKAKVLYQSLQSLLKLDEKLLVMPGHTSKPVAFDGIPIQLTLKEIKKRVSILKLDETSFVETILKRIPPTPANYLAIVEHNISGNFSDVNPLDLEAGANRCAVS